MKQLGFELAERGATHAADKADRAHAGWTSKALEAFRLYALNNHEFTTEDVVLANPDLPAPPDKRSFGAIAIRAQRMGYVKSTNKLARAKSPHAHKRPLLVWQSAFLPTLA